MSLMPYTNFDLADIKQAVQHNCHIADANAAGNYTLCIYLLKMREFYRWESGYNYGDNLPNEEVGTWLRAREELWEKLQEENFTQIPIDGELYDPFDSASINRTLTPQRLIYSGGLGRNTHAHFFLGVLERYEHHHGFDIIVVADEYARDLTAPPAMSQGKTIYIRREAMRRMIWEKYEQWLWNKPDNAMGRALQFYPFESRLDLALEQMTDNELDAAVLHEIGEVKAYSTLGEQWEQMLFDVPHSKLELLLRSARDHFADCSSTLPALIEQRNVPSLHFYIGNLTNLRKEIFPGLLRAYEAWLRTDDYAPLQDIASQGLAHWESVCKTILHQHRQPDIAHSDIIAYIETNKL